MTALKYTQVQLNALTVNQRATRVTSFKYRLIKSDEIYNALTSQGFELVKTITVKPRKSTNVGFTKHVSTFRPSQSMIETLGLDVSEGIPQLIVINDHSGKSSLRLIIGYLRFVCSNGLVSFNSLFERRVKHVGNVESRIETSIQELVAMFPQFCKHIETMKSIQLTDDQVNNFISYAGKERLPDAKSISNLNLVNLAKHQVDADNNLWSVFNRIQENLITSPVKLEYTIDVKNKVTGQVETINKSTFKKRNSPNSNVQLNRALWRYAETLAA